MQTHLEHFGTALSAKCAQDQAPSTSQSSLCDSLQPQCTHGLVVVVLPGEHLAVGVISKIKHQQAQAKA